MPETLGAHIRPYESKDSRLIHFLIGKANFGVLAVANNRGMYYISPFYLIQTHLCETPAYIHPIILAIWVALSAVLVQYLKWWPKPQTGWFEYLKVVPAFAAVAVPVMFFVDW